MASLDPPVSPTRPAARAPLPPVPPKPPALGGPARPAPPPGAAGGNAAAHGRKPAENTPVLPPLFLGFDRFALPDQPRRNDDDDSIDRSRWLALFQNQSNLRFLGAYLKVYFGTGRTRVKRHWIENVLPLRGQGWGVGVIYLGTSKDSFRVKHGKTYVIDPVTHRVKFLREQWLAAMTAANGILHAKEAKQFARRAGVMPGSVLYFDNEDPEDIVFEAPDFDYYTAFFTELATPDDSGYWYRPGFYAHQKIAAQVLPRHPELFGWEVDYGNLVNLPTQPPQLPATATDARFRLDPTSTFATIKSFRVSPPAPSPSWLSWPVVRQWEGNNEIAVPRTALPGLNRVVKWDWNSALVRDPADPQPTPRLAAGTGWLAQLDDVDATFDATRTRARVPRHGRLTVTPTGGAPIEVPAADPNLLAPGTELTSLPRPGAVEIVARTTLNELCSTTFTGRACTPVRSLFDISIVPGLRLPMAVAAVSLDPGHNQLFWAADDGRLWASRRDDVHRWDDPVAVHGQHRTARMVATVQGGLGHVLTVDANGMLLHLVTTVDDKQWPPTEARMVNKAADPVLPFGALGLADGGNGELVAVAIGTDMRLRTWRLRRRDASTSWSDSTVLGRPEDTLHPYSRIGMFRPGNGEIRVDVVNGSGRLDRYPLTAASGWTSREPVHVTFDTAKLGGIHPFTDLPILDGGQTACARVLPARPGVLTIELNGSAVAVP